MGLTRSPLQLLEEATEAHMPGRVPSFASCILRCPSAQSQGAGLAHSCFTPATLALPSRPEDTLP